MRTSLAALIVITFAGAALTPGDAAACTNFLVTKGASADGSTMITYAADSHEFYGELVLRPAGVHQPGATREIYEWDTGKFLGRIARRRSPTRWSAT
jgi:hypothetical protein